MNKETVLDTIKALPQHFQLEELIEKLVLAEKIEQGLQQLHAGQTTPHENVQALVKEWQK
jgi:predicted transcriptional regulator